MEHVVTVEKRSQRRLKPAKVVAQIRYIQERTITDTRRSRGWSCTFEAQEVRFLNEEYIYKYNFNFILDAKRGRDEAVVNTEFDSMVKVMTDAGRGDKWRVLQEPGHVVIVKENAEGQQEVTYATVSIPRDWRKHFNHIYDRSDQIEIAMAQLQAAIDSNWTNRFHNVFIGEPAGGKTETARSFKKLLGDDAVLELDGTGTTMAGAIKTLNERRERHMVPRVLIIEEIEKADFKQYPWLLAVLDPRAEIRKINARQKIHMQAQMFCIATVNNYKLFKAALEGALASRFSEPIFFPRPNLDTLRKILLRDVSKMKDSNPKWIDAAIAYAEETKIDDPRHILSVCLSGRDALLNGAYQKKLRNIRIPDDYLKA